MIKKKDRKLKADDLRYQVRFIKAIDTDWSYKNMAEAIGISTHSFYNWLCGAYELGQKKEKELNYLISLLLDQETLKFQDKLR